MIPLPPPVGYWPKVDKLIRKYLWNGGQAKIKLSKLQNFKRNSGQAVSDLKLYFVLPVMSNKDIARSTINSSLERYRGWLSHSDFRTYVFWSFYKQMCTSIRKHNHKHLVISLPWKRKRNIPTNGTLILRFGKMISSSQLY